METNSLFSKAIHPFKLALAVLIFCLLSFGVVSAGLIGEGPIVYWEAAFISLLIFVVFSSVLSFSYPDKGKYFLYSIISFIAIAGLGGVSAHYLSGVPIDEAGSFRWLYIVFTFTYLVLLSIVNLMFTIIQLAKKQDARLRGEVEDS